MGAIVRLATLADVKIVSNGLRKEDALEVVAQGYKNSENAIMESFKASSLNFVLESGGMPVAIFGVAPLPGNGEVARIWLLGTEGISKIKKSFCEWSVVMVEYFLQIHPVLIAQVDGRYEKAGKWLQWLGADKSEPYNIKDVQFNNFVFDRR